ncbi:MAG: flagellar biosynthesis anti-sigma factor FlgM [Woeseia sp.]|nr:flagellar biosynthesis anti-sigma factor FlgM [Woeseia sp.]NNE59812.1 flagellar biosynthesis anti-sigma factor FlgM [Woeseia sp.]NNL54145.1 flagellar biosynthesis anti-sigma factor FlgM [Woeseia sp.]
MINKLGDKIGNAKEALSTSASQRIEVKPNAVADAKSDTVELTSGAKLLERLEKSLESLPDINQERVDAVKTAIANGDYTIDADKIADALVRFDREFGR